MKRVDKLVIKIELQTEDGKIVKECPIHEIKAGVINSILDIGIKEKDVQIITEKVEKELTKAQEENSKKEIEIICPNCNSKKSKKKP